MKLKNFIIIALISVSTPVMAQYTRFVTQGTIVYEKRVNTYAIIKKQIALSKEDTWGKMAFENYQKNNPQFKTLKSTLIFNNEKSLFVPEEEATQSGGWFNLPQTQQNNTVLSSLNLGTSTIQKKIYEENYTVADSIRKINWKITDEFRNIAGYNCRRANALVMDSVYVVAFYTDEIAVSGGPETFSGLPGMILGVALPHDNITWFATSVTDTPIAESKLALTPKKGKTVSNKQLFDILKSALKSWGTWANETFKWAMM
ncbi:GLPGLI family protein [Pedobacter sp. UBA4863]|uniref:GLPGLI family protein n=1 Tax=Pedobacter sp. UBA4863 TaxID=1947060 RepID=UPI0025F5F91C|nr:GLPGLI family protein [Pedobacter sp. UBA4863]